jgi:DNA-binding protein HU-beta
MKKAELVAKIILELGKEDSVQVREEVSKMVNATFNVITDALKAGDSYNHDKFGTFKVVHRAARKGRNPKTGEEVMIPETAAPKFVVSKQLKDKVSKK